jgi:hypothetical protein
VSYTLFSVLEFVVLLRYPNSVDWGMAQAWIYVVVVLASVPGAGLTASFRAGLVPSRPVRVEHPASSSA